MVSTVYALSIHAGYRCRNSGACCTADWDVPVELPVYRALGERIAARELSLAPLSASLDPFIVEPDLPDDAAAILQRNAAGECVFFERSSRLCAIHQQLGEPALPATCRHFPRLAVRDARGTFITLSHFCPTAASLLFEETAIHIVTSPSAFPPAEYEGLVVSADDLPPLLHPRMLMDAEGYAAWERHMVSRCAQRDRPEEILATLSRDARVLRGWKPNGTTLAQAIVMLPRDTIEARQPSGLETSLRFHQEVLAAVPDDLTPPPDEHMLEPAFESYVHPVWERFDAPLKRYLAAKAFASWTAYQGKGIATIVRGLEAALALVRVEAARQCRNAGRVLDADLLKEAFRSADFALNHLAVSEDLVAAWSAAELGQ